MRDDDLGRLDRLAVVISHGHLALGVGSQRRFGARVARLRDRVQDLVSVIERRRQELRRFAAGITEHDSLVACAFILVTGGVDPLGDVGRLGVQQDLDLGVAPVEALLLVADILDRLARGRLNLFVRNFWSADFPGDNDAVGRGEGLARDADLIGIYACSFPFSKEQINDFVGNPVANLVRMSLGHGFTGELVVLTSHIHDLLQASTATMTMRP